MDFWGCEFLELESYSEFKNKELDETKLYFPIDFLLDIADQRYLQNIVRKDAGYIENLKIDINKNGLLKDLKVTLGTNGLMLGDGHHRLCALRDIGYTYAPAEIKLSNNNLKVGSSYFQIIERLIQAYAKREKDI